MKYYHADVFSKGPLSGNGLTVMICDEFPDDQQMQSIAKELKQFETIFLRGISAVEYDARIFTVDEELDFAGHPILGAAAAAHSLNEEAEKLDIVFHLRNKDVTVESEELKAGRAYQCCMDQGRAELTGTVEPDTAGSLLEPVHISYEDLSEGLPIEVCTTGLPYLIVPVARGIEKGGIFTDDYEQRLDRAGAKFVYVIDTEKLEGRTWDNNGMEDVATGSAAGPAGDYLIRHGICRPDDDIVISQGRFLGRPSQIHVRMNDEKHMLVSGRVDILGRGTFEI